MRQSESTDEEDEHFEDIVEESEDEPKSAPSDLENDTRPVENGGGAVSDDVSSEDDDDALVSSSDDEVSDEADEFLIGEDPKNKKSKVVSGSNGKQSQVSSKRAGLPGGYDPRHREPSYWSVFFSELFHPEGTILGTVVFDFIVTQQILTLFLFSPTAMRIVQAGGS